MKKNEEIRNKIQQAGIFQYAVADKLGVSEMTLIRWLRKPPTAKLAAKIENAIKEVRREKQNG